MRLAENGGKGDYEDLVAEIIAGVQEPLAPIFQTRGSDQ